MPKAHRAYRTRHQLALEMLAQNGAALRTAGLRVTTRWDAPRGFVAAWRLWVSATCWRCLRTRRCVMWRESRLRPVAAVARPSVLGNALTSGASRLVRRPGGASRCAMGAGPLVVEAVKRRVVSRTHRRQQGDEEVLAANRYRDRDHQQVESRLLFVQRLARDATVGICAGSQAEHRIEECLQRSKSQTGLADYEVRHWRGWQQHQTLSFLATWFLVRETQRGKKMDPCHDLPADSPGYCHDLARGVSMRGDVASIKERQKRLQRNELARFYHWKQRNRLAPLNLYKRQFF